MRNAGQLAVPSGLATSKPPIAAIAVSFTVNLPATAKADEIGDSANVFGGHSLTIEQ